jgi:spore coat protein U-like protein
MRKSNVLALAGILFLAAGSAFAGTTSGNLAVSATVSANCSIAASQGFAFGPYDPIGAQSAAPLQVSNPITLACTNGSPVTVTMDQGLNPAGGSTAAAPLRQMTVGGNFLPYNLYTSNTYTTVWDGVTGAPYTGTGAGGTITVFGQIAQAQNVPAGTYVDTVVVTLTF